MTVHADTSPCAGFCGVRLGAGVVGSGELLGAGAGSLVVGVGLFCGGALGELLGLGAGGELAALRVGVLALVGELLGLGVVVIVIVGAGELLGRGAGSAPLPSCVVDVTPMTSAHDAHHATSPTFHGLALMPLRGFRSESDADQSNAG